MLYISRIKHAPGEGHIAFEITHHELTRHPAASILYGVVDTDDGKEQLVSQQDLAYSTCMLNMSIAGTAIGKDSSTGKKTLLRAAPYQLDRTRSANQKKLASLYGVDLVIYNGAVVGINYDGTKMSKPATIHISQFCDSLGDYLLMAVYPCRRHALTVVLDDNVKFSPYSLCGYASYPPGVSCLGAKFDIRDVSNVGAAYYMYQMLYRFGGVDSIRGSLIDEPSRMTSMLIKFGG